MSQWRPSPKDIIAKYFPVEIAAVDAGEEKVSKLIDQMLWACTGWPSFFQEPVEEHFEEQIKNLAGQREPNEEFAFFVSRMMVASHEELDRQMKELDRLRELDRQKELEESGETVELSVEEVGRKAAARTHRALNRVRLPKNASWWTWLLHRMGSVFRKQKPEN